jgi:hypothetical protein
MLVYMHTHYMFQSNWPFSSVKIGFALQVFIRHCYHCGLYRFVLCRHACVQFLQFLCGSIYSHSSVMQSWMCPCCWVQLINSPCMVTLGYGLCFQHRNSRTFPIKSLAHDSGHTLVCAEYSYLKGSPNTNS